MLGRTIRRAVQLAVPLALRLTLALFHVKSAEPIGFDSVWVPCPNRLSHERCCARKSDPCEVANVPSGRRQKVRGRHASARSYIPVSLVAVIAAAGVLVVALAYTYARLGHPAQFGRTGRTGLDKASSCSRQRSRYSVGASC